MAKKKKFKPAAQPKLPEEKKTIFDRYPAWITIGVIFVLLLIFYNQIIFQGRVFLPPDQVNSKSALPFMKDALERDIYPLWCPYLFSGMPAVGSLIVAPNLNIIDTNLYKFFELVHRSISITPWLFYLLNYLLFGGLTYLMLKSRKLTTVACMFGAVAVVFIPQYIAFTAFGHNTKFLALALIPLIFFLVDRLLERRNILYFSLAALAIGFQLMRAHVQVTYYTFLFIGIFYLFKLITDLKDKKSLKPVLGAGGLLVGAIIAGILLSSVLYVSVQEYSKYSIRGGGPSGGLSYDYASGWSFHPFEMITFIVPAFMGFGQETYWGKMPFTDYPLYFGVVVFLLAGAALVLKRDRFTIFLAITALFSLVVSFGNFLPILYGPMFKFLPFFDKFRVPSMIHILLDFVMVVLAAVGLHAIIDLKTTRGADRHAQDRRKPLFRYFYIVTGVLAVVFLYLLLARTSYLSLTAGEHAIKMNLRELAYENAVIDAFKSLILVGLAILFISQYLKNSINKLFLAISLIVFVIIDLWWVDFKIIRPTEPVEEKNIFASTPVVQQLKTDPGLYRIFPVIDEKSGNWYMYHKIQNVLGYHAAKLRLYQDFLDETGFTTSTRFGVPQFLSKYWQVVSQGGQLAWQPILPEQIPKERLAFDNAMLDMLNVKYIVSHSQLPIQDNRFTPIQLRDFRGEPYQFTLYENNQVLPRAFFASSVKRLQGRKPIFDYMKSGDFDPRAVAIIEDDPPFAVAPADSNTVTVTKYDIREIHLQAQVKTPAVMVLSEIYYPAGWKAFVDGRETKIYKTNYLLRSIFLKPGNQQIRFVFNPSSFQLGFWISLITLIVLIGMVGFAVTMAILKKHKPRPVAGEPDLIVT